MTELSISRQTIKRLPTYYNTLKRLEKSGVENISATALAAELGLNHVQVRKDLAQVSSGGRPKTGYRLTELKEELADFLGYNDSTEAILVGTGHLGRALLCFEGMSKYGLEIAAAFDNDESVIGTEIGGKTVFSTDKMSELVKRLNIHIGIITVPAEAAQRVCDAMVAAGILAVWNFTMTSLKAPEGITVQSENMAASLALLSKRLSEKLKNA